MYQFDYESFKSRLKEAAKQIFLKHAEQNREEICGFSLYSDESAMIILTSVNTYTYLHKQIKEEPLYEYDYRFSPEEWKYVAEESGEIDDLCKLLSNMHFEVAFAEYNEHRDIVFNIAVEALVELKQEKLFAGLKNDFVLMFSVSDFDDTELLLSCFERLNSKKLTEQYEEWLDEMDDDDFDDDFDDEF